MKHEELTKKNIEKVENRAKKILKYIDDKNYSQEELLAFNYEILITFLHRKLFKTLIIEDEIYLIQHLIIEKCTDLDKYKSTLFYGTNKESVEYISLFNGQMAHYFDESIVL
jgi:hypothetical protein